MNPIKSILKSYITWDLTETLAHIMHIRYIQQVFDKLVKQGNGAKIMKCVYRVNQILFFYNIFLSIISFGNGHFRGWKTFNTSSLINLFLEMPSDSVTNSSKPLE